jgi:hypothetical protein
MSYEKEDLSHDEATRPDKVLNLRTVQKMLPLVQQIVADILRRHRELDRLNPAQDRLERQKRVLTWQQRKERYLLQEEIALHDRAVQDALEELQNLGVVVLDGEEGRVGFPTLVNNRAAYFTWRHGEDGLNSWQFAEENVARPIPPAWLKDTSFTGKSTP